MEHIIDTFINGTKNMTKNPVIFVPFLLLIAFTVVFSIIWNIVFYATMFDGTEISIMPTIADVIYYLVLIIPSVYISAGMIGMSKEAVSTGKTSFKDLFTYGNKYTIPLIFASIILSLLQAVIVIFWLPVVYLFMNSGYTIDLFFELLVSDFDALIPFLKTLIIPAFLGFLLTLIYLLIISILFYFVTYAIVVDDMPVIASFKKSYAMICRHFWKVLAFIIALYIVTNGILGIVLVIFYVVIFFTTIFILISPALSILSLLILLLVTVILLIVAVLISVATFVWTTRFYMSVNDHELCTEINTEIKEDLLTTDF